MLEPIEHIVDALQRLTTLRGNAPTLMPEGWAQVLWKEGKNL